MKLSLRLSYALLAALILVLIIIGLANPYGNDLSQSFFLGLSENIIAALLIIALVDRIIAANSKRESERRKIIAVRGLRFALRQHLSMLFAMFKASLSTRPERDYRTPKELFDDYYVEQVGSLDFSKKAPVIPDMTWYDYLAGESKKFREQLNMALSKFSTDIDPKMLEVLEELINSPLLSFLILAPTIPALDSREGWSRSQNLLGGLGPIVKDYVTLFSKLLELFNSIVDTGDKVNLDPALWREDVAPKLGNSRVGAS